MYPSNFIVRVTPRTSNPASYRPVPANRATPSSSSSRSIISAATLKHHGRTKVLSSVISALINQQYNA